MGIVIKKTISLEFLGDEYKDGYVTFKSISVAESQGLIEKIEKAGEDNSKAIEVMLEVLGNSFIEGKFVDKDAQQDVKKEDLKDFDIGSVTKFFAILTGQEGDPKA